jgi:hypothetical protein
VVGDSRAVAEQQADVSAARALIRDLPSLTFDEAEDEGTTYRPKRNLFGYAKCPVDIKRQKEQDARRAAAEQERRQRAEQLSQQRNRDWEETQKNRPPPKPAAPRAPEPDFKYVAYMGRLDNEGRPALAVFEKGRGKQVEMLVVQSGEVVESVFVLKLIDWDRVELGYTDPKFSSQKKVLERQDL